MDVSSPITAAARALRAPKDAIGAGRPARQALLRLASANHVLALADQALASGTSFLALIMVARATDPAQLGAFAIGNTILGVAIALHQSLVSLPYSIQRHDMPDRAAEHAFASLVQSGVLSAAGGILLAAAALALSACGAGRASVNAAWALAALMPFVLAKEFAREFAFAHFDMARAVILDAAVATVQFAVLGWLAVTGRMSAVTAFGALGVSCGIAVAGWFCATRAAFAFRAGQVRTVAKRSWDLGKWLFASRAAVLVQGYATHWLSLVVAGAAVTGLYAACMSVVSLANPVLFGIWNLLTPRSVLAWKDGGAAGLRRRSAKDALLLGGLMGAFCVAVLVAGDGAMRILYPSRDYDGHGHVVTVLAVATLVWALGIPASNALASMERPRPMAAISGLSAGLNVLLVWCFLTKWGLSGAAFAVLAANAVGTLGRWTAFLALARRVRP